MALDPLIRHSDMNHVEAYSDMGQEEKFDSNMGYWEFLKIDMATWPFLKICMGRGDPPIKGLLFRTANLMQLHRYGVVTLLLPWHSI